LQDSAAPITARVSIRNFPYDIESFTVPFMQIEADYSESDSEQSKVRMKAFLEMISIRPVRQAGQSAIVNNDGADSFDRNYQFDNLP